MHANVVQMQTSLHDITEYVYLWWFINLNTTVKPVLSGHSKIDKIKVLKSNDRLMKVESIAECSLGAFCNTFDLHEGIFGLENQLLVSFLSGRSGQVLLYFDPSIYTMNHPYITVSNFIEVHRSTKCKVILKLHSP